MNKYGHRIVAGDDVVYARPGSILERARVSSVMLVEGEHDVYDYKTHQYVAKPFTRTDVVIEVKKRRSVKIKDPTVHLGYRWEAQEYVGKKSIPVESVAKIAPDESKIP